MNNETILSDMFGYKHCLYTNSGSAAFHSFLLANKFEKGDEIIFPIECYPTFPMIAIQCGLKPIFVDVDENYNLDPVKLRDEITDKTRFIVVVHMAGIPAKMEEIEKIVECNEKIILIEDSCQAVGTFLNGGLKKSQVTCAVILSFSSSKLFSLGSGGALLTDVDEIHEKARIIANNGFDSKKKFVCQGYSYAFEGQLHERLSNLLNEHEQIVKEKQENAHYVMEQVSKIVPLVQEYDKNVVQHKVICEDRQIDFMNPESEKVLESYKDVVENHYPKVLYDEIFFEDYMQEKGYELNRGKFSNFLNKRKGYLAFRTNCRKDRLEQFLSELESLI